VDTIEEIKDLYKDKDSNKEKSIEQEENNKNKTIVCGRRFTTTFKFFEKVEIENIRHYNITTETINTQKTGFPILIDVHISGCTNENKEKKARKYKRNMSRISASVLRETRKKQQREKKNE
ncbi:hypothetical protein CDIK_4415, partial [Cucumispora dikerogammari]